MDKIEYINLKKDKLTLCDNQVEGTLSINAICGILRFLLDTLFLCLVVFPHLERVDQILPKHVCSWGDGNNRVEEGLSHPNGKNGIFLSEGLTPGNGILKLCSQPPAKDELQ